MIAERWDLDKITSFIHLNQRRRNFIHKAHQIGRQVSWEFQPYKDASKLYHRSHMTWLEADKRDMFRPNTYEPHSGEAG